MKLSVKTDFYLTRLKKCTNSWVTFMKTAREFMPVTVMCHESVYLEACNNHFFISVIETEANNVGWFSKTKMSISQSLAMWPFSRLSWLNDAKMWSAWWRGLWHHWTHNATRFHGCNWTLWKCLQKPNICNSLWLVFSVSALMSTWTQLDHVF